MHLTFVKRWYNKREGTVKQSLGATTDTTEYAFPWCFELLIMIVYACSFALKTERHYHGLLIDTLFAKESTT
jgi:hypothetical protein